MIVGTHAKWVISPKLMKYFANRLLNQADANTTLGWFICLRPRDTNLAHYIIEQGSEADKLEVLNSADAA